MAGQTCESNKFKFTWEIENFNFYRFEGELKSPLFNIKTSIITSWYLGLYNGLDCFDLYLVKKRVNGDEENISYKIDIIDSNGQILYFSECDKFSLLEGEENDEVYETVLKEIEIVNCNKITIHCFMFLQEAITNLVNTCEALTQIETEQSSFKWDVENFLMIGQASKTIVIPLIAEIRITLSTFEEFVSIIIERKENFSDIFTLCKISLLDVKGLVKDSRKSEYLFEECANKTWKFPDFVKMSNLSADSKYYKLNTLSLLFEFSISNGKRSEEIKYCHNNSIALLSDTTIKSFANLQENFRRMYVEQLQTDVKISAGTQTLQAHKFVLSARSPVFAAEFQQDTLENQKDVVDIPDIEFNILDLLLRFMYDGTVNDMNYESAYKLLIAADKYQVPILKEMCSDFLMSSLNNENVCDVLILANKIAHEPMKDSAVHYIVEHADVILSSESWSQFIRSHNKAATDIIKTLSFSFVSNKKYDK